MTFTDDDLHELAAVVIAAWRAGADRDWSARAATLDWSCAETAAHAIDTVFAPAFFLASRKQDDYPALTLQTPQTPALLIDALQTAVNVLSAVVQSTAPGVRAIIWRRPRAEVRPPADFLPRGALELILHAHDVCEGLGVEFVPPEDLCDRLRRHTRDWPMWQSPGWQPLTVAGPAWPDLLRASGRVR